MQKTWIDDEGRLRLTSEGNQFVFPGASPLDLDPWISYDSWDAELAIRLITIGYNLDIKGYWESAKDFPYGSTGWDSARSFIEVYERGMSIAKSSIAAGLLQNPDTPTNWLTWAERKGYDVSHLKQSDTVEVQPDPERRLAALRALGGSAKWKRDREGIQAWQFTGIQKLVAQEKADGRKRSDEKTIRDDLREAAETETMKKRNAWNR